jgi:hypothetical protein
MTSRFLSRPIRLARPVVAAGAVIATATGMPAAQAKPTPGWRVIRTWSAKNSNVTAFATLKGSPG